MGIIDKIMFWRKKNEFSGVGLGDKENLAFGDDFGAGPSPNQSISQETQPTPGFPATPSMPPTPSYPQPSQFQQQFQSPRFESPQQDMNSKNLEIISSKLDALRASIESLNQRLANLETIARGDEDKHRGGYY